MQVSISQLQESEIATADQIFRLAFGTFVGLPNPMEFCGDATYIPHRWKTEPTGAFAAYVDNKLVGTNLATRWGKFGFLGPLTVHPDYWGQGIAQKLLQATMKCFEEWGIEYTAFMTFANSPKHHGLYQKFGYYPRFLTAVMSKSPSVVEQGKLRSEKYSEIAMTKAVPILKNCFELTNSIYSGLDLSSEIEAVRILKLGDTVLLWDDSVLIGFAICHCGAQTEAGSNTCYIKFSAVRSASKQSFYFEQLLIACETFSLQSGMSKLIAGVNTSHHDAYCIMNTLGFRTELIGVAMHKSNQPGFSQPHVIALYDLR
ncbi:MAG: GNAT family N-acetyltransferase [Calothrix sp. FI2-JRJ7]|jgi:GNAT superfamily N-acetyltransferase|nr:GNAT family N-acetyltransferase [Calothrix sp. FI2-JRJ7]